jgi:hypothetical protein
VTNYAPLIAAWNNATQPPPGITGTALTALTTAQKIAAVNAWTITGSVPTVLSMYGAQALNCINYAEFKALTAQQQSNLLMMCGNPQLLLGGSSNSALLIDGMFLDYFSNHSGPTILALTALAQAQTQLWVTAPVANGGAGLSSLINAADLINAGGLT